MIHCHDGRAFLSRWDVGVPDAGSCYPNWEVVYADNANWVYRMIFARVGNSLDAEDLTAEVFLAALRALRITATVAQVRGYLRATTRTVLATYWRQTIGRETTSIDDVPDLPQDVERAVDLRCCATSSSRARSATGHLSANSGIAVFAGSFDQRVGYANGCDRRQRQGTAAPSAAVGGHTERRG
jgi:Sigma-70 region 2